MLPSTRKGMHASQQSTCPQRVRQTVAATWLNRTVERSHMSVADGAEFIVDEWRSCQRITTGARDRRRTHMRLSLFFISLPNVESLSLWPGARVCDMWVSRGEDV